MNYLQLKLAQMRSDGRACAGADEMGERPMCDLPIPSSLRGRRRDGQMRVRHVGYNVEPARAPTRCLRAICLRMPVRETCAGWCYRGRVSDGSIGAELVRLQPIAPALA